MLGCWRILERVLAVFLPSNLFRRSRKSSTAARILEKIEFPAIYYHVAGSNWLPLHLMPIRGIFYVILFLLLLSNKQGYM